MKGSVKERRMYLFWFDFSSCSESAEIWHSDSLCQKMSLCFFSRKQKNMDQITWKSPPPHWPLEGVGGGGEGRRGWTFKSEFEASFPRLWKKKPMQGHFLTQKESACQSSSDSEQLEKSNHNRYICLPLTEPFNCIPWGSWEAIPYPCSNTTPYRKNAVFPPSPPPPPPPPPRTHTHNIWEYLFQCHGFWDPFHDVRKTRLNNDSKALWWSKVVSKWPKALANWTLVKCLIMVFSPMAHQLFPRPFQFKFNTNLLSVVMVLLFQHFTGRLPVLHKETRWSDNINLGFIKGQRTTWKWHLCDAIFLLLYRARYSNQYSGKCDQHTRELFGTKTSMTAAIIILTQILSSCCKCD